MSKVLTSAIEYLKLGWKVFPVHSIQQNCCTCKQKEKCPNAGKHPATSNGFKDASRDSLQVKQWFEIGDRNIGLPTGPDNGIVVIDIDPRHGGNESLEILIDEVGDFRSTLSAKTGGGGFHYFFKYPKNAKVPSSANLRSGIDVRGAGGYVVVEPSIHRSGLPYAFDIEEPLGIEMMHELPEKLLALLVQKKTTNIASNEGTVLEGSRNVSLTSIGGKLRQCGLGFESLNAALQEENKLRCSPPLPEKEVAQIATSVSQYALAKKVEVTPHYSDKVFYGAIGRIVQGVAPITEAHPMAILSQLLVGFGNIIGKKVHFKVSTSKQYPCIYVCLVGKSAKARKGMSWSIASTFLKELDIEWYENSIQSGLSSGEGLIAGLQDANKRDGDGRLLVIEPEFGAVLIQAKRSGNILTSTVREAWDGGRLQTMTKGDPLLVDGYHLSIVGHVTQAELNKELSDSDRNNGLGNRFLWCYSCRTQLIPNPQEIKVEDYSEEIQELKDALCALDALDADFVINMIDQAKEKYSEIYMIINQNEEEDSVDALTSRAEPYVIRIAIIHAIAQGSMVICAEHIEAAFAFVKYCIESAQYIFGTNKLDKKAQKLLDAIIASENGLSLSECHKTFSNHLKSEVLQKILELLLQNGFIEKSEENDQLRYYAL